MLVTIVVLSTACLVQLITIFVLLHKKPKPLFGSLKINLKDPNEDTFKLEVFVNDPNELLKHTQVLLKIEKM